MANRRIHLTQPAWTPVPDQGWPDQSPVADTRPQGATEGSRGWSESRLAGTSATPGTGPAFLWSPDGAKGNPAEGGAFAPSRLWLWGPPTEGSVPIDGNRDSTPGYRLPASRRDPVGASGLSGVEPGSVRQPASRSRLSQVNPPHGERRQVWPQGSAASFGSALRRRAPRGRAEQQHPRHH